MKFQPYRSLWGHGDGHYGYPGAGRRYWKRRGHKLFRHLNRQALRFGGDLPYRVSVDDGS